MAIFNHLTVEYVTLNYFHCCRYCDTLIFHLEKPFLVVMVTGVASPSICMFRVSGVLHIYFLFRYIYFFRLIFSKRHWKNVQPILQKLHIIPQLMQVLIARNNIVDMFIPIALVFIHISIIFYGNHIGQQMTNNNAEIFDTVWVYDFRTLVRIV